MLRALLKNSFLMVFSSMFRGRKNGKKLNPAFKIIIGIFALYVIACIFGAFIGMFWGIYKVFSATGFDWQWLYFAFAGIFALAFCFIGSVLVAQKQMFEARDNELLLSMPIPSSYILMSRILVILLLNYLYESFILLPAIVVYFANAGFSVFTLIAFVISFITMPFFAMVFSCLFGWILGLISSRLRNKNIIPTIFSVVFLMAYFYIYSQFTSIAKKLMENGESIGEAIKKTMFPIYHFGVGIGEGNLLSVFLFVLCATVLSSITFLILSKSFIKITTANRGAKKIKYQAKEMKQSSVQASLLKREIKHFVSNPLYLLNGAFGDIFMIVLPIVLILKKDVLFAVIDQIPMFKGLIAPLCILMLITLASTNIISAPSVSLEGKTLWLVKSLPVSGAEILLAKAKAHVVLCLPASLFASLLIVSVMDFSLPMTLFVLITPAVFTVFQGLLGVFINLKFPKFDYLNEVAVIKQSMATMLTMFGSMGIVMGLTLIYIAAVAIMSPELYILLATTTIAALAFGIYKYLKIKGDKIFAGLGD